MKRILVRPIFFFTSILAIVALFSSCNKSDYIDAIPKNSIAIMAVDLNLLSSSFGENQEAFSIIKDLIGSNDLKDSGLDLAKDIYLFETIEGNFGLVGKVENFSKLDAWFNGQEKNGFCKKTAKSKDFYYTVIKDSWVVGFSSNAIVVMGPTLPSQASKTRKEITKYLSQEEKKSIKSSPLYERLQSMDQPIRMIAKASALPKGFTSFLLLGIPKEADPEEIIISSSINITGDSCLEIRGKTFSLDEDVEKIITENDAAFRKIKGKYLLGMPKESLAGIFINSQGEKLLELLKRNPYFQGLLLGANMGVDMDEIIKSIDGDVSIILPKLEEDNYKMDLAFQLSNKDFLKDVNDWKKSCPSGSRIEDWGKDSYIYETGDLSFYFGVTQDLDFFLGASPQEALATVGKTKDPLPQNLREKILNERMAVIINLNTLLGDETSYKDIIKGILSNINTIIYFKADE
ncbi:MAG: DUF4836 family protein [Prevotella sp.]|nr:DUF4836 family protein [Prevotella sp.]